MRFLRHWGYLPGVVERFNAHVGPHGQRFDLYGCIDIVATRIAVTVSPFGVPRILGVQTTSAGNLASRVTKTREVELKVDDNTRVRVLPILLAAGWEIHVHGWVKRANGKWAVRVWDMRQDREIKP